MGIATLAATALAASAGGSILTASSQRSAGRAASKSIREQGALASASVLSRSQDEAKGIHAEGAAIAKSNEFEAGIAERNKKIALNASEDALARGQLEEAQQRVLTRVVIGRQRAKLAASGQVVTEGSAVNLVGDTAGLGELEALIIRSNAQRESQGFKDQAGNFQSQADLLRIRASSALEVADIRAKGVTRAGQIEAQGIRQAASSNARAAKKSGDAAALGTLLGGASSVATKWSGFKTAGVF